MSQPSLPTLVDHAPLCQPDRSSPAPSPPPPIARHHRHRYLRRDLRRCKSWGEIAVYGRKKADWLQTFLELPGGLPSKDTFRRVFARIEAGCLPVVFSGVGCRLWPRPWA